MNNTRSENSLEHIDVEHTGFEQAELNAPGLMLGKARAAAELSLREVADTLHLLPKQIAALEADDYQQLSGEIFCKSYLRNYGKLLGIDPEILVERYLQYRKLPEEVNKKHAIASKLTIRQVQRPGKGHSIQYWCLAVSIAIIIVLWVMSDSEGIDKNTKGSMMASAVIVDENDRSLVLALTPPTAATIVSRDFTGHSKAINIADTYSDQFAAISVADEPGLVAIDRPVTKPQHNQFVDTERTIEQKTEGLLYFHFSDDCWVEVKDSDNKVIFADLKRAADTLELSGNAPFRVLLGYAPGVSLDYNGKSVAIGVNQKNNSARLVIGRL
ncbi:MAG: RodZ domain-containing protein [Pseudomonadales bacterium]